MVNQFLNSGFERELASNQEYNCMSCLEPITNPICHDCLGKSVKDWLGFYPSVKKKFMPELNNYLKEVNNNILEAINCSSCKKEQAALCPYCFAEGLFNLLKRNKIDKMVIMDFLSTFNFDLKHEGYIRDAAEEGLW